MDPVEKVIKKAIAKVLNDKGELDFKPIRDYVKNETGHGASRSKSYLDEMVGAGEVAKKPRKLPKKSKTTYMLSDGGRRWLKE